MGQAGPPTPGAPPIPRRQRIKARGGRAARVEPLYAASCALVDQRSKGRCERPGCPNPASDHHHVFGRRSQIGADWSNRPECLLHLCRDCHREVTDHPRVGWSTAVKWCAVSRMAHAMGLDWSRYLSDDGEGDWTPLQAAMDLVRRFQQTGKEAA